MKSFSSRLVYDTFKQSAIVTGCVLSKTCGCYHLKVSRSWHFAKKNWIFFCGFQKKFSRQRGSLKRTTVFEFCHCRNKNSNLKMLRILRVGRIFGLSPSPRVSCILQWLFNCLSTVWTFDLSIMDMVLPTDR